MVNMYIQHIKITSITHKESTKYINVIIMILKSKVNKHESIKIEKIAQKTSKTKQTSSIIVRQDTVTK